MEEKLKNFENQLYCYKNARTLFDIIIDFKYIFNEIKDIPVSELKNYKLLYNLYIDFKFHDVSKL